MTGTRILAVNYHYVRPKDIRIYPGLHARTPEELALQCDALAARGSYLSPERLLGWLEHAETLADEDYFLLTFDDGLRDHVQFVAPELELRGWKAFFFVNTQPWEGELTSVHRFQLLMATVPLQDLAGKFQSATGAEGALANFNPAGVPEITAREGYPFDELPVARFKFAVNIMLPNDVRERVIRRLFSEFLGEDRQHIPRLYLTPRDTADLARRGHTIGLHSHQHRPLAFLPEEEVHGDLTRNREMIRAATGTLPWAVSYPYGGQDAVSPRVVNACRLLKLRVGFTMNRQFIKGHPDPLALNRVDTNDAPGGKNPLFTLRKRP